MGFVDKNDALSYALDVDALQDWVQTQIQSDELRYYCPSCMTMLALGLEIGEYYCPNELCLDERVWVEQQQF